MTDEKMQNAFKYMKTKAEMMEKNYVKQKADNDKLTQDNRLLMSCFKRVLDWLILHMEAQATEAKKLVQEMKEVLDIKD